MNATPTSRYIGRMRWLLPMAFGALVACASNPSSPPVDAGPESSSPPRVALTEAIAIDEIAAYQTIKLSWWSASGTPNATVPLLRQKASFVRVFVRTTGKKKWTGRPLDAELHFGGATDRVLHDRKTIAQSSTEAELSTTFDFPVDASTLTPGTDVSVVIRDGSDPDPKTGTLRAPASGALDPLAADAVGRLKVVVVPVRYMAGGIPKLPHTEPEDLATLHDYLLDMYPVSKVEVSLHASIDFAGKMDASGAGWASALFAIENLRASDVPEKDAYYVGAVTPAASWPDYCGSGCVAGMAPLASPTLVNQRAAIVLGFGGISFAETSAHELGHAHGRQHAPCGNPAGIDPAFPYSGGASGVPGFRLSSQEVLPDTVDVMSYCQGVWISDYNYSALLDRVRIVAAQQDRHGMPEPLETFERWLVDGEGHATSGGKHREPMPDAIPEERWLWVGGVPRKLRGFWSPFDHGPGGTFVAIAN